VFGERKIEDLPIPLSIVVTGVVDGQSRVLTHGRLVDALYASITIFPLMECIRINNVPYVDGAFSNPIPVNVGLEAHPNILLITTFTFKPDHQPNHFFRFINNLFCLSIEQYGLKKVEHWMQQAKEVQYIHLDYMLSEPLSIVDTNQLNTIIQLGEHVLKQHESSLRILYE